MPLSVQEVQAELRTDEALVLFVNAPGWWDSSHERVIQETFVWVVTKTDVRWVKSDLTMPELQRAVAALRCGLDRADIMSLLRLLPLGDKVNETTCAHLLNLASNKIPKRNAPLPFDLARTHTLYKALLGQVEDLIRGKHLLVVPSGPLAQQPFHVLVTSPAGKADYRSASWLARKNAIMVLPAVSSLKALRRVVGPNTATKPIIGFGNPLLDGDPIGIRGKPNGLSSRGASRCARRCCGSAPRV